MHVTITKENQVLDIKSSMEKTHKGPGPCNFHVNYGVVYCNLCGTRAVRTRFGDEFFYWCNYNGCKNEEMCSQIKLNLEE